MKIKENFIFKNPLFVLLLGLCPALAVSNNVNNALGMSLAVIIVLTLSNFIISLIRKFINKDVRIPIFIVVIASLVTSVNLLFEAFLPDIHSSLGIFLPLVTTNCLILARAESYASKNKVKYSIKDGLINALSFSFALILLAVLREGLSSGHIVIYSLFDGSKIWLSTSSLYNNIGNILNLENNEIISSFFSSIFNLKIFQQPAGAFIILAFVIAFFNFLSEKNKKKKEVKK